MKLSVIIPSIKEESLRTVLPRLETSLENIEHEILIAARGAESGKEGESGGAVITYIGAQDEGYGASLKAGIAAAQGEFCVVLDEDSCGLTEEIPKMVEKLCGGCDFVIGSRYADGGSSGAGKVSKVMSKGANRAFAIAFGIKVKDVFSRFCAYKTALLKELTLDSDGTDINEEIIVKLHLNNEKLIGAEIPVCLSQKSGGGEEERALKTAWSRLAGFHRLRREQKKAKNAKLQKQRENEITLYAGDAGIGAEAAEPQKEEKKAPTKRKRIILAAVIAAAFIVYLFAGSGIYLAILSKYEGKQYISAGNDYWSIMTPGTLYSQTIVFENNGEPSEKTFIKEFELCFSNIDQTEEGTLTIELINGSGVVVASFTYDSGTIHGNDYSAAHTTLAVPVNSSDYTELTVTARSDCETLAVLLTGGGNMVLTIITIPSGIFSNTILIAALFIIGLPVLVWALFKFKVFSFKKINLKKLNIGDIVFGLVLLLGAFLICSYDDIDATGQHGFLLAKLIFEGKGFQFYDYASSVGIVAVYDIALYLVFAIWNSPFVLWEKISGRNIFSNSFFREMPLAMSYWNKTLAVVFFFAAAYVIYKICIELKMGRDKSKWAAFAWAAFPITFFSGFVYGQYDAVGVFFLLCAILALLKDRSLLFSFLAGLSFCMKPYIVLAYVPILLLKQKKLSSIAINFAFFGGLYLLLSVLFAPNPLFILNDSFLKQMIATLSANGIAGPFAVVSFIIAGVVAASIFAYKYKPDSVLQRDRMIIYLAFFIFASFFAFASWNAAYWQIFITPFLIISLFQSEKSLVNTGLLLLLTLGFCGTYICNGFITCFNEIQLQYGIFKNLFINGNPFGLRLADIYTWFGLIPGSVYTTLFTTSLVAFMVLLFPARKKLGGYALGLKQNSVPIAREESWLSLLLFFAIYIIPCLVLYFAV